MRPDIFDLYVMARVPAEVRATLRRMPELAGLHATWIEDRRLHLTLFALGRSTDWPHRRVAQAKSAISGCRLPRFRVAFDGCVVAPKRMLLKPSEALLGVEQCQGQLRAALADMEIAPGRHPPHVTLGFDVSGAHGTRPILPISWEVEELKLVMSLYGHHRHLPLHRWRLAKEDQTDG
jgi:2'-5' RNA ligase